jgi:hypothetical protein
MSNNNNNNSKEWLEERFYKEESLKNSKKANHDDDSDHDSLFSIDSNDTLHKFIDFQSHRNSIGLEEAISFTYPYKKTIQVPSEIKIDKNEELESSSSNEEIRLGRITISTLLEEDDLVPIFDGAGWAGTRVWSAAIWAIKYLIDEFGGESCNSNTKSLCELGCGLGVPGMIWHQVCGGDVVLSDQDRIMSQLRENVKTNFQETQVVDCDNDGTGSIEAVIKQNGSIHVQPLDWSREGYHHLLETTGFSKGFDIILNCDCVYEPLYGNSWELLAEVIDESLKLNPSCYIVTSVERRTADGIDNFIMTMRKSKYVGSVEKVLEDKKKKLELYITKGLVK